MLPRSATPSGLPSRGPPSEAASSPRFRILRLCSTGTTWAICSVSKDTGRCYQSPSSCRGCSTPSFADIHSPRIREEVVPLGQSTRSGAEPARDPQELGAALAEVTAIVDVERIANVGEDLREVVKLHAGCSQVPPR